MQIDLRNPGQQHGVVLLTQYHGAGVSQFNGQLVSAVVQRHAGLANGADDSDSGIEVWLWHGRACS